MTCRQGIEGCACLTPPPTPPAPQPHPLAVLAKDAAFFSATYVLVHLALIPIGLLILAIAVPVGLLWQLSPVLVIVCIMFLSIPNSAGTSATHSMGWR